MFKPSLIYKDALLIKDSLLTISLQLLFIAAIISINLGVMGYYMVVMSAQWSYLMMTSQKDKKNNAQNILLASAYTRKQLAINKYIFCLLIWVVITVIYWALSVLLTSLHIFEILSLQNLVECFFNSCILLSITIPLYFVLDDSMVRYLSLVIIFGIAFLRIIFNLAWLDSLLKNVPISLGFSLLILVLSAGSSVKILETLEF